MKHTRAHICSFITISGALFLALSASLVFIVNSAIHVLNVFILAQWIKKKQQKNKWLLTAVIVGGRLPSCLSAANVWIHEPLFRWMDDLCENGCLLSSPPHSARCSCLLRDGGRITVSISRATTCLHPGHILTKLVFTACYSDSATTYFLQRWEQCFLQTRIWRK